MVTWPFSPAGLLILLGLWSLGMGATMTFVNWLNDQMNPENPDAWLDKNVGAKIWFNHPSAKIKMDGKFDGIEEAPGQAPKGKKKNYNVVILKGKVEKYRLGYWQRGKEWDFK